ncbi:MAG: asparagine synthase-related protein, partial [Thermodesulfobacteriota bacterium]|nr:asparagine synthase-related protein [Thermodesulfobacteriota bacterium]
MSGICGISNMDGKPLIPSVLDEMMNVLSHRGPDGSGVWYEGPVGLGHHMLYTTPESLHEKLPQKSGSTDLVITADSRIDNRDELLETLGVPHHMQNGMPDSIIILKAYEKWGEDCPNRLLGDFAFAIWDVKKRQLFCARDHIGIKAFYYHSSPCFFAFASEIKGVLSVPNVPCKINEVAVADFLVCNQHDWEGTFYKEILRLPPAHCLVLNAKGLKVRRYWKPEVSYSLKLSSNDEYAEALREQMFCAVHCRMRSAFPIGVTLSGGLDSSSVACIAARKLNGHEGKLIAVSSALPENHSGIETDEREYIEAVRRQENNIDVEYVFAKGVTPFDNLDSQFVKADQPFRDLFYYMSDALYDAVQRHGVRILLSGFGGDITVSFNGMGFMAYLARTGHWFELARILKQRAAVEKQSQWKLLKGEVLAVLMPSCGLRLYRWMKGTRVDSDWISHSAIHPAFANRLRVKERCEQYGHSFSRRTLPDVHAVILDAISPTNIAPSLEYMNTSQAAFHLEYLHPLLDKRIIELCLSVP